MMRVPSNTMIFGYPALALLMFLVGAALGVTLVVQAMLADRRAKPSEQHGPN
jgi:ubiquinone biosynthesis protein